MDARTWPERIKQLLLEIEDIQDHDDMEDVPDTQSMNTESGDTTNKDPTANKIHPDTSNTVPEINNIFATLPTNSLTVTTTSPRLTGTYQRTSTNL